MADSSTVKKSNSQKSPVYPSPTSVSSALIVVKDRPFWDLTANVVYYPLTIPHGGVDWRLYIGLRPYSNFAFKTALERARNPQKLHGQKLESARENFDGYNEFVLEHFAHAIGFSSDNIDAQRAYLERHSYLLPRIFKEGPHGIADIIKDRDDAGQAGLALDLDNDRVIELAQTLYSPRLKVELEVKLTHTLRHETQVDYHKYNRATGGLYNLKRRELQLTQNYDAFDQLYNAMHKDTAGYAIDGKPASPDPKELPLPHKALVLNILFEAAQVKND